MIFITMLEDSVRASDEAGGSGRGSVVESTNQEGAVTFLARKTGRAAE
jgi:hypothetical protein